MPTLTPMSVSTQRRRTQLALGTAGLRPWELGARPLAELQALCWFAGLSEDEAYAAVRFCRGCIHVPAGDQHRLVDDIAAELGRGAAETDILIDLGVLKLSRCLEAFRESGPDEDADWSQERLIAWARAMQQRLGG